MTWRVSVYGSLCGLEAKVDDLMIAEGPWSSRGGHEYHALQVLKTAWRTGTNDYVDYQTVQETTLIRSGNAILRGVDGAETFPCFIFIMDLNGADRFCEDGKLGTYGADHVTDV